MASSRSSPPGVRWCCCTDSQQRQHFHNDLHGDNIKVVTLDDRLGRRQAIHPRIQIKVFDLGSAGEISRSGADRLGDVHWVAKHILELLNSYEKSADRPEPRDLRLCAQLRRVAEYYCGVDRDRAPKASDMKAAIIGAYRFGVRPWSQPVRLGSISEHYNAQTLPSWFAPQLLYDPGERWGRRLMGPGPQLLVGMRGCGKTILLRSLEWVARLHPREGETPEGTIERVRGDSFLGLFVSCASLHQSPKSETLEFPLHRLFLAFAREVIRNVQACELEGVGEIDYTALGPLDDLVATVVPWYKPPGHRSDAVAMEQAISRAFQGPLPVANGRAEFNPRVAFDDLAAAARRLVDLWSDKKLLFLLDDVSLRYLPERNVLEVLSQLCLQSPEFGFKLSTETQTLSLTTPGGEPARGGRDYETFDLGVEVLATLRGPNGPEFIQEVLYKRTAVTDAAPPATPTETLGRQNLVDIAHAIRDKPSKSPVYWGVEALTGVCVGDIGDVLQIYAQILDRAGSVGFPIDPEIQHRAMMDFAEGKLFSLAGRKQWLYAHAVAFATASYQELKTSAANRLREYAEISVKIASSDAADLFPRIIELIDAGVFVFTGGTPRTKTAHGRPFLQFKLAYRKVLGLTNRIPLATRDRFELSGDNLMAWLDSPSAAGLKPTRPKKRPNGEHDASGRDGTQSGDKLTSAPLTQEARGGTLPGIRDVKQLNLFRPTIAASVIYPAPHVLYTVETDVNAPVSQVRIDWSKCQVIGAFGFEVRSIGAWNNLLAVGRPARATMLQYDNIGLAAQIIEVLNERGVSYAGVSSHAMESIGQIHDLIASCATDHVVVDTTSLTKALIYQVVLESLRLRNEAWVLHTCAAEYYPPDADLEPVVAMLRSGDAPDAFQSINAMVAGESGPYQCVALAEQHRDPSQPSFLAAFVPLKYDRLAHLLDTVPIEAMAAIAPVHSGGQDTNRAETARYLARYFVQRYTGSIHELSSLDHQGTYRLLKELHAKHALDGGYNFEIALTGAKMHAVGAAMFAATATPASVYYSSPRTFDPEKFTRGTAVTRLIHIQRSVK